MNRVTRDKERFALIEQAWVIAALGCLFVAVIFAWRGDVDAAFVAAALGVVAWFLNYRNRLSKTLSPPSAPRENESNAPGDLNGD